jgi:hypothetical protein
VLVNPIDFVLLAAEVAKILDKIDGVVDHGVISKIPLVFSLNLLYYLKLSKKHIYFHMRVYKLQRGAKRALFLIYFIPY